MTNSDEDHDPTANVLALVRAASQRLDDLRAAETRYNALEVRRLDDLAAQRHNCDAEILAVHLKASADLTAAESRRLDLAALAEQRRIDAINSTQKADVAMASEKAATTAATLAQTLITTAEALRSQANSTQDATNKQIQRLQETIEARLQTLDQSRYIIGGRTEQQRESRGDEREDKSSQYAMYGLLLTVVGGGAYIFATLLSG